jgi:hypothetical protein
VPLRNTPRGCCDLRSEPDEPVAGKIAVRVPSPLYFIMIRVFDWLVMLGRSEAPKDV